MRLEAGTQIGAFEILAAIGAGGMGEVYRARDTRLARDVALKILPAEFAADPSRVARFRREAQVLASLNHPRIAAIYGIEERDRQVALALEFVDGEDLAVRIARGRMAVDEAVAIARQIAEGLLAAEVALLVEAVNLLVRFDQAGFAPWHWALVLGALAAAYPLNLRLIRSLAGRRHAAAQP